MIVYAYLLLILEVISGQRTFFRGDRYDLADYYNSALKTPTGVGVLKDFSNSNILSHEPFIINLEFPKLGKSGDNRKSRYGSKRSRRQKKKNRRLRPFRHIVLPEGDLVERAKRFQFLQRHPNYELRAPALLVPEDNRRGKNLFSNLENKTPLDKSNFGRFLKFENEPTTPKSVIEPQKSILQQIINPKLIEDNSIEETVEADNHRQWEDIKSKWISLFSKDKDKDKEANNETDEEEEKHKLKSRKIWANCQLLKLLKAPQRNPLFYKLLPPNYPALIMNEEKQLQCNKVFDIIDLSRDKKMISDKIEQLEKILSSEFKSDVKRPEMISGNAEETSQVRRRRDVEIVEKTHEPENTLHDETLQGKSEGDGRSDRSSRTKKRQKVRGKERDRDKGRDKIRRRKHKGAHDSKQDAQHNEHKPKDHSGNRNSRMAEPEQITSNDIPKTTRLDEKELAIKPDDDSSEQKRDKLEIKKDSILQDVFKPSEVNKVIKQKELEANIFDKVVRTMKKFEENNPYDESFKPQKRESRNETGVVEPDSGESILEVDDAVKKLAKIFKILGVRSEAKKCENCDSSEEVASEEDDGKRTKKLKMAKQSKKCICGEDCPLCQDCLKCFRECKKNAVASKNMIWSKQTPGNSQNADEYEELIAEKKPENLNEEEKGDTDGLQDEIGAERGNSIKVERTYRTKLPSSRDQVRLYYDNPQNKLLVWTKRGRRTMPWGPLTSDLQLYRDRARRILKSAEDILQRIKDTEEKIHASEQYGENDAEGNPDKNKPSGEEKNKEKVMDDIIKKVVNEDVTKSILRAPWEAELNKTQDNLKELEEEKAELQEEIRENEEPDYHGVDDKVSKPKSEDQLKADEKVELENTLTEKEPDVVEEKDALADTESKSIEAAVESIEGNDAFEKAVNDEVQGIKTDGGEAEEKRKSEETEDDEYEDFPAKVESVRNKDVFPDEMKDEKLENFEDRSEDEDEEEDVKLEKTLPDEFRPVGYGTEENVASESAEEISKEIVKASKEQNSEEKENEELEDKEEKSASYENDLEEVEKSVSYDSKAEEADEEHSERVKSTEDVKNFEKNNKKTYMNVLMEKYGPGDRSENIFQDQIKPIEKNYIIKGVEKTQEEKQAILKALLHAEGTNEEIPEEEIADLTEAPEMVEQTTAKAIEHKDDEAFKTLVNHISNGHMDEKDFEEVKNLDQTKIDSLVGEMQKKDKTPTTTSCDKELKLCKIACGCNGTDTTTDIDKYDIIKGFLGWLKSVQIDQMVPISA